MIYRLRPIVGALLVACLGGCGLTSDLDDYLGWDGSGYTPVLERGSFEDSFVTYEAMLDEMAAEMALAFPDSPPMRRSDDQTSFATRGDNDAWDRYGVQPENIYSVDRIARYSVSNTRERADLALATISRVAAKYGFEDYGFFNNRIAPNGKGYVSVIAVNSDGDSYRFDSAKYTTVNFETAPRFTRQQLVLQP